MENDEDLAVHEIIGFLRYLLACAGHDAPFDIKAHIPRVEKLIENYDEAVSRENFNSISEGLTDAIKSVNLSKNKLSVNITEEDLLNDDPLPFFGRPSEVAAKIMAVEDERVLTTLLNAISSNNSSFRKSQKIRSEVEKEMIEFLGGIENE